MRRRPRARDRRAVVHVGAHKTGTTVIQQYLATHPDTLWRRRIRYVPRPQLTPLVGWGEKLVDDPSGFAALLADFVAGRDDVLLLSHENLCGAPFGRGRPGLYPGAGRRLEALARAMSDAAIDTTVLLTVRPQHELVDSYYLQTVNIGSSSSFREWLAGVDLDALSWLPLVAKLQEQFGSSATVVHDFGLIRDGGVRYVTRVLQRCGIELPMDESWERSINRSVSERGLRMLLRGNAVLADPEDRAALRKFVQREFSNLTGDRPALLNADERDALRKRHADEYRRIVS